MLDVEDSTWDSTSFGFKLIEPHLTREQVRPFLRAALFFLTEPRLSPQAPWQFSRAPTLRRNRVSSSGTAYSVTVVVNVPGGTDLGTLPLVAETGTAKGPATIQGIVTALNGTAGANIDVTTSALQTVSLSGGATRPVTIPLLQGSTSNVAVESATPCPATGSPKGAFCAQYTLVVPASNPDVGSFSAGKITFTQPASGDVLYTVEADATKPMSGGSAICSPSSLTTNQDTNGMPIKVTAGATTTAKEIDFSGCS